MMQMNVLVRPVIALSLASNKWVWVFRISFFFFFSSLCGAFVGSNLSVIGKTLDFEAVIETLSNVKLLCLLSGIAILELVTLNAG